MELTNLAVHGRRAERIADDPEVLLGRLEADFLDHGDPPPGAGAARQAVESASVSIPHARESWQDLQWPGRYREFHVTLDLLSPGFHGLHVVDRVVSVAARWANPLWEALELDTNSERELILQQLNQTLASLPPPAIRYVSMADKELEAARLPGAWLNLFGRVVRMLCLGVKSALQTIVFAGL